MDLILGALVLAYIAKKVVADSIIDHDYAKKGLASPRMQAKYGPKAEAKVAQYGFGDFLRDAWRDYWPRRTEALVAARNARDEAKARGESVGFRKWIGYAKQGVSRTYHRMVDERKPKPRPEPEPVVEPGPPARAVDTGDVPVGTRRMGDDGLWQRWDGTQWKPEAESDPQPEEPAAERPAEPEPATEPAVTKGPAMTAPTGEAVNYETTVNELQGQIKALEGQVDAAEAVVRNVGETKAAVDQMQQTYRQTADAAQSKLDHEAALNLDGTTLGHAGTQVDSLPPSAVDTMYDHLEQVEQQAKDRLAQAEAALAATEAELRHLQDTYGDANATVAGNLGGDARFLDSSGGATNGGASGTANGSGGPPRTTGGGSGGGSNGGAPPAGASRPSGGGDPRESSSGNTTVQDSGSVRTYEGPIDGRGAHFGQGTVNNATADAD